MANIKHFDSTALVAFVFTLCAGDALANNANAVNAAQKTASIVPTKHVALQFAVPIPSPIPSVLRESA